MIATTRSAFAIVGIIVLCGCGDTGSPARPPGLPKEATYAGGVDGGDWVACRADGTDVVYCRVFDPKSGALRYESWFRYCPAKRTRSIGQPMMLDADGLLVSDILLRRDRPDVFHPPHEATAEQIHDEQELINKTYRDEGVRPDCTRVQNH